MIIAGASDTGEVACGRRRKGSAIVPGRDAGEPGDRKRGDAYPVDVCRTFVATDVTSPDGLDLH